MLMALCPMEAHAAATNGVYSCLVVCFECGKDTVALNIVMSAVGDCSVDSVT